jgi:hypothetical protein
MINVLNLTNISNTISTCALQIFTVIFCWMLNNKKKMFLPLKDFVLFVKTYIYKKCFLFYK